MYPRHTSWRVGHPHWAGPGGWSRHPRLCTACKERRGCRPRPSLGASSVLLISKIFAGCGECRCAQTVHLAHEVGEVGAKRRERACATSHAPSPASLARRDLSRKRARCTMTHVWLRLTVALCNPCYSCLLTSTR